MRLKTLIAMATWFIAALIPVTGNTATPVVLVQHNEQFYGYMTLPRLSEVVVTVNKVPALYWPAGRLYKTNPDVVAYLESQRQDLLQSLNNLQQYYLQDQQLELANSVEHVKNQIKTWILAQQQMLPLDPDRVRAKQALNPRLLAGQYLLQVDSRPGSLSVVGFTETTQLELMNATDASDYIKLMIPMVGASTSFLYILPATSSPILAQTGLWNQKRQDVPAGAVLFVPFEQRLLPAEFDELNQQVVELLQHRVVL
ncbi:capsule biosynthesis GfcC D2 domain-containing protein [Rheinheimera soli]|uniref:Capsule biosynthesis GfcC n=1 Tax=Rheinheimera soli TaxID=443616 RepID=A0ABU1VUD4_9GAMM|nr:capsule biosynthesis GfcC D2 domain-containing protein [Rheinheimera soli]MDR7119330.1 hypothetical protein [Rheinheimera soli]